MGKGKGKGGYPWWEHIKPKDGGGAAPGYGFVWVPSLEILGFKLCKWEVRWLAKCNLANKKTVHGVSRACIKPVTCWMRFVYCNFGASWFNLRTFVRMRHGPKPVPGHYQVCKRNCKSLREGWLAVQNVTFLKLAPKKYAGNIPQGYPIVTRKPTHLLESPNWRQCGWMVHVEQMRGNTPWHAMSIPLHGCWFEDFHWDTFNGKYPCKYAKPGVYICHGWVDGLYIYLTISHCFWLLQSIFCINWWLEVVSCHYSRHSIVRNSQHHQS